MMSCISELDIALSSVKLKLTTVELLIECAGWPYISITIPCHRTVQFTKVSINCMNTFKRERFI